MDPLLQLLDRGLQGNADALTFLERTASIYIFDGTNPRQPKTFGIWDFLNQALTEIERVETRLMQSTAECSSLVSHVQLLTTIAKRAAHRTFDADRKNIQICLENAAQYHGSPDHARLLIQNNGEMRQRVMGRIAAIVFDFSYHLISASNTHFQSAFTHPVAMESLCALVAANTVSSSPHEVFNLVTELILPGVQFLLLDDSQQQHHLSIPPFSAAALLYHIGVEAKGKYAPAGTRKLIKEKLFHFVLAKALAPILLEALRDSDAEAERDEFNGSSLDFDALKGSGYIRMKSLISSQFKIASIALKALNMWITITDATITQVILAFDESRISFIEVISEAMYSDSVSVLEAIATLMQVLFRDDLHEKKSKQIKMYDDDLQYREHLLTEIVSAIGLQKTHFMEAQRQGLSGVCHALSNIASTTVTALSPSLSAGKLSIDQCCGLIDLLSLCSSHPLIHICSVSIAAFSTLTKLSHTLAIRILQILQSRAIIPPNLVGLSSPSVPSDVDYDDFESFRENILSDVLHSCYITSRSYYIESCVTAVEEFCLSTSCQDMKSIQLPLQLEAALYCLCAVAGDATKRALLHGVSPAAQVSAEKASCAARNTSDTVPKIAADAEKHDGQLTRCVTSLASFPNLAFSNKIVLGRMCHFLCAYADWISKTKSPGVINEAAGLAVNAFNHEAKAAIDRTNSYECIYSEHIPPFTEAAMALRNILKRAPERFTTPEALTALEASWRQVYEKIKDETSSIAAEDKKIFCGAVCSVLILLPVEDRNRSIKALSQPVLDTINRIINTEQLSDLPTHSSSLSEKNLNRLSEEVQVLSTVIKSLQSKAETVDYDIVNQGALYSILYQFMAWIWPCLGLIAARYSWNEQIASSLIDLLQDAVTIMDVTQSSLRVLNDFNELIATVIGKASSEPHTSTLLSMIEYVIGAVDMFGIKADSELLVNESMHEDSDTLTRLRDPIEASLHLVVDACRLTSSRDQTPDVSSGLFKLFSVCIKSCPKILLNLPIVVGDQRRDGHLLALIIERALTSVTAKEVLVARHSMLFLRDLIHHCIILGREENFHDDDIIRRSLEPLMDEIRIELTNNLLYGACGNFPQDVIEPAASLFMVLLYTSEDVESLKAIAIQSLNKECFLLGDDAKAIVLSSIMRCIQANDITSSSSSFLMNLFTDLWHLHQIEDKDMSLADSDDVAEFLDKYSLLTPHNC